MVTGLTHAILGALTVSCIIVFFVEVHGSFRRFHKSFHGKILPDASTKASVEAAFLELSTEASMEATFMEA